MKNLKVRNKMLVLGVIILAFVIFSVSFAIQCMNTIQSKAVSNIDSDIRTSYDNDIKNQVSMAVSLMDEYNKKVLVSNWVVIYNPISK